MGTHVDEAEDDDVGAPSHAVPAGVGAAALHHLGLVLPDAGTSHDETGRIGPNQHGTEMKRGAWQREPRRGGRAGAPGTRRRGEANEREAHAREEALVAVAGAGAIVLAVVRPHGGGSRSEGRGSG